jgi:CheY-like chemotaxis protein
MAATRTVLAVDDDDDHALLLRTALRRVDPGVHLLVVETGEEAAARLAGTHTHSHVDTDTDGAGPAGPRPCLLLLELLLPGMGGFGLLSWCREREELRGLPRVALTSSVDPRDRQRALELGAQAVRSKAPDVLELGETVAEILDRWAR